MNSLKIHGKGQSKYDNVRIGLNSRLDTIQAALLKIKLAAFKNYELKNINKVASMYNEKLNNLVEKPQIPKGFYSSYAQYTIKLKNKRDREALNNC